MPDFEDKPTNGYSKDKRLIEFRLDEIDGRTKAIQENQDKLLVAFTELKTEFRIRVGIMGGLFGLGGAFLMWILQMGVEKIWGG